MNVNATVTTASAIHDDDGSILVPSVRIEMTQIPKVMTKEDLEVWLERNAAALLATVLIGDMTFNKITKYLWELNLCYRVKVELAKSLLSMEGESSEGDNVLHGYENDELEEYLPGDLPPLGEED
jgi:hypothetical protein